jgi:hypothetical protein
MNRQKLLFFLLLLPVFLNAQTTADNLEALLNTEAVSYEQAAALVLEAADIISASDAARAFNLAMDRKWLPAGTERSGTARLDGVSLLIMKSFDFQGGIFYSLFGNPHYAYRELQYNGIIRGRADPAMDVSGDMMLFLIGNVLDKVEAGQ